MKSHQAAARAVAADPRWPVVDPGAHEPEVAAVAKRHAALGLSPVTVASAYRELREKGIARGNGRAGTKITGAPPIGADAG